MQGIRGRGRGCWGVCVSYLFSFLLSFLSSLFYPLSLSFLSSLFYLSLFSLLCFTLKKKSLYFSSPFHQGKNKFQMIVTKNEMIMEMK